MTSREIFSRIAARYDSEERLHIAGLIADEIRSALPKPQRGRALDYGCATGLVGLMLLDCFDSMLLADLSPEMIALAQGKIDSLGLANASTLCCDFCEELPPQLESHFDVIVAAQTLLHVPDYKLLLQQLHRALRKGGTLFIVDFDRSAEIQSDLIHPGFDQAQLCRTLEQEGFTAAASYTFYRGENLLMNQPASMFLLKAKG